MLLTKAPKSDLPPKALTPMLEGSTHLQKRLSMSRTGHDDQERSDVTEQQHKPPLPDLMPDS